MLNCGAAGRRRAATSLSFVRDQLSGMRRVGIQLRLGLAQAASHSREAFIVSPSNVGAVRAVDEWRTWHAGALALFGPEAVGKTHLALAWAEQTGAAVFVAGQGDVADLAALQGKPVLFEDADRGAPDDVLFHLINMAGVAGGGLLLTGRTPPSTWSVGLPDLRSRLNALTVAELPAPDDVVLEGLLRKFFREQNIKPNDDLFPYLLRRMERSATAARDLVDRLDQIADAEGRNVSRTLARQILERGDNSFNVLD
jgi:chromosomal replication initiation ATPase DnaA